MNRFKRVVLMVMDSVGTGALPDAAEWGDAGSHTFDHVVAARNPRLPLLRSLGMGNIAGVTALPPAEKPLACYGRAATISRGKDTTVGHWEMTGIITAREFPTYPGGFPPRILEPLKKAAGRGVLGNRPASGTVIIEELGREHMRTGDLIVYTSADSVFQIAAHEEVVPVEELYRICGIARKILAGPDRVDRVIARPFTGTPGSFVRTGNRRDFAVKPPEETLLDRLKAGGVAVIGIGKIPAIFDFSGVTDRLEAHNNAEALDQTLGALQAYPSGLIFSNLGDFDMLWGHRRDSAGYAKGLEYLDTRIEDLMAALRPDDILILTADHGCDPTFHGSDHTREYVPILVYGKNLNGGVDLGTRSSLADIGQTAAENFRVELQAGTSFLALLQ
jgi:phosphopentomutase